MLTINEAIHELNKLYLEEETLKEFFSTKYEVARPIDLNNSEVVEIPNYKNIPGCDSEAVVVNYSSDIRARVCVRLIILNRREDDWYVAVIDKGSYLELPGGGIEESEKNNLNYAARREAKEETGLNIPIDSIESTPYTYIYNLGTRFFTQNKTGIDRDFWWTHSYNYVFYAEYVGNINTTGTGKDAEPYTWMSVQDLIMDSRCKPAWKAILKNYDLENDDSSTYSISDNNSSQSNKVVISKDLLSNYVEDLDTFKTILKTGKLKCSYEGKDPLDKQPHVCFSANLYNAVAALKYKWKYGVIVDRQAIESNYQLVPYDDFSVKLNAGKSSPLHIKAVTLSKDGSTGNLLIWNYDWRKNIPGWIIREILKELNSPKFEKYNQNTKDHGFFFDTTGKYGDGDNLIYLSYGKRTDKWKYGPPLAIKSNNLKDDSSVVLLSKEAAKYLMEHDYKEWEYRIYPSEEYVDISKIIKKIILPKESIYDGYDEIYVEQVWTRCLFNDYIKFGGEVAKYMRNLKEIYDIVVQNNIEWEFQEWKSSYEKAFN